jgi:hypothetical protein
MNPPALFDHSAPVLLSEDEAAAKVANSTIPLPDLVLGNIAADAIELAFSPLGCGAVLVRLDEVNCDLYNTFYRLQWQLCSRASDCNAKASDAAADFAALDLRVRLLLCQCAVSITRARLGLAGATSLTLNYLNHLAPSPLNAALGRPLFANRHEFHPSVDWLLERASSGQLQREEHPEVEVIADTSDNESRIEILGRVRADEAQLLELYQEWKSADPAERRSHGNKYNGNIYYGAFRGRTHLDGGSTMTILLGPGEVRDSLGWPAWDGSDSCKYGGNLIVKALTEEKFTGLPYRLRCGSPYVVAFFNETDGVFPRPRSGTSYAGRGGANGAASKVGAGAEHQRAVGIDTIALGWSPTVHGVRRIEDTRFSRGQTVVSLRLTYADLASGKEQSGH